jgi:hypothetical protein
LEEISKTLLIFTARVFIAAFQKLQTPSKREICFIAIEKDCNINDKNNAQTIKLPRRRINRARVKQISR